MYSSDDISADLILLESQSKILVNTLGTLQGGSSLASSLTPQCQKLQVLSNSILCAIHTRFEKLQSKENEIENRLKELALRENELGKLSKSKLDDMLIGKGSSLLGLKFIVSTDGERLLMYLNEHENEHEKLADEVYGALKMSNNPGKLVWAAVRGVFLEKGNVGIERNVERRSCMVLLEGLMRVRPEIKKKLKKTASFAAKEWKLKDDMDILLFLMLVGAYGLLDQFIPMEIRSLFERVAKYKQASLLGHILGFVEKAAQDSCFLHSQVKMEQLNEVSNVIPEATDDTLINYPHPSSADLRFLASTNADRLLMFLNEHGNDDKIGDDVYNALKESGNPAKLGLNVVEAGISVKANVGVERGTVKNSCMVLLEQLMRLRPQVRQKLKKKALKVAQQWKGTIKTQGNCDKEVLVFLMLVGVYGLISEFNFKEIESLFVSVSQHRQAPMLSRILSFVDQTLVTGFHPSEVKVEQSEAKSFQLDGFLPSEAKFEQRIASSSTSWGPALLSFTISMDAMGLISFLSEHVKDHNLMRVEISDALKLASDPAKLVLDALSCFFCTKSGDGFKVAALCNARKSCILLLEQLISCPVQIERHVSEEALKLAAGWKERMEEKYPQGVMAYGFLQFIIAYHLKSGYNVDDLLSLLVTASEYRQSPELCLALGLADKISILIETLIKKNLRLEAIAYICGFNRADMFHPSRVLNDHLKYSKRRMYQRAKKSNAKQNQTIEQEIAIVRRVIRCITDHKLDSLYPPEDLEKYIVHLESQKEQGDTAKKEKKKADGKKTLPIPSTEAKLQEYGLKGPCMNMSGEATASTFDSAGFSLHLKPSPHEQSVSLIADQATPCSLWGSVTFSADSNSFDRQHRCAIADDRSLEQFTSTGGFDKAAQENSIHHAELIDQSQSENFQLDGFVDSEPTYEEYISCSSTNSSGFDIQSYITGKDARGLLLFLCDHVDDHELMRSEISDALQLASDPAKLVLGVLSTFHYSGDVPKKKKKSGCGFDSGGLCKVRRSCILLLEQLRTFPLQIEPNVNEEALKLAAIWKERTQKYQKGVMAYGFLQLIVTYRLISTYDANELLGLLILVSEYRQSPALCLALGLADKIHVLVETLIKNNQRLEAIAYICAFDLVDKFPPANVLKVHLGYSKESLYQEAKKYHWKWHRIIESEIAVLRKVIECIADHKLESLYAPEDLKYQIMELETQKAELDEAARKEKQKTGRKKTAQVHSSNSKSQQEYGTNLHSPNVSAEATPSTSGSASSTTKLSAFQILESFFADQAVPHGLWDNGASSADTNLSIGKQHTDIAIVADNGSSASDCSEQLNRI